MKKLLVFFCLVTSAWSTQMPALNIQTSMTSADMAAFGRITPYATESVGNVLINPASLGGIDFHQLTLSTYQLASQFDYRHVSFAYALSDMVVSLSYGSNVSSGFVETINVNNVIYDIGSFSSGFDVLHLGVGKKINEGFFFIHHFYVGMGLNMLTQVIGSNRRAPSYGLDAGLIATLLMNTDWLSRVDVGVSVINAVSTGLPAWSINSTGTSAKQVLDRQLYGGMKMHAFDYSTAFHGGVYVEGTELRDIMVGLGTQIAPGLELRLSTQYDVAQTKQLVWNMGSGIQLQRVAGMGSHAYDMSVDYNYTYDPNQEASHTIGITFLGQSMDRRPVVLSPNGSFSTNTSDHDFNGTADRHATVYAYNGSRVIGQAVANNNGQWVMSNVMLDPGYNPLSFRAKSGPNDMSPASSPIVIHYDQVPPTFNTDINIMNDRVAIQITANEPLRRVLLVSGNNTIRMKRVGDRRYSAMVSLSDDMASGQPIPRKMQSYHIVAIDTIGNQAPTESVSFFVEALFPADQTVVYSDAITVLGYASPHVHRMAINGQPITTDKNHAFSTSVQLDYGKQLVTMTVQTTNQQTMTYYARLLCIKRFDDIPKSATYRRDIEFLATLGYITGKSDGLFHPNASMTRREVALAIANQKQLVAKPLEDGPFLDVPIDDPDAGMIAAAVEAGIISAGGDGRFRPNETVSVADAFRMLNNAGVIDSDDVAVSKKPIKRYEFALMFKQVRRYDQRILYLMDWEQGYTLP